MTLPPLYERWMTPFLGGPLSSEPAATCDDCAMLEETAHKSSDLFFEPSTKCCTFIPSLPNYLIGCALLDDAEESEPGRQSLRNRIRRRKAVTPLGLGRTLGFSLRYRHSPNSFGRMTSLRCPHYIEEGGLCGIWKYRNGTCSTWFCKHAQGFEGLKFWRALQGLLTAIERNLGAWCVLQLNMVNEEVLKAYVAGNPPLWNVPSSMASHLMSGQLDETPMARPRLGLTDRGTYQKLWGDWLGREEEFYKACAKLVMNQSWEEVLETLEDTVDGQLAALTAAHTALSNETIPPQLYRNPPQVIRIGAKKTSVASYSVYDPLQVPTKLLEALDRFDGRPTKDVLAELEAEGVTISDALLRKLIEHCFLKAEEPKSL